MNEIARSEGAESLRDRLRRQFHTMKGLDELAAEIPQGPARDALPAFLSEKFGVPGHGSDNDSLKRLFIFCRLKLDTYPDAESMQAVFLDAVSVAIQPGAVQSVRPAAADPVSEEGHALREAPDAPPAHAPPAPARPRVDPAPAAAARPAPGRAAPSSVNGHDASATADDPVLFPGQPFTGDLPIHYPSLLLPCPDQGRVQSTRSRWLSGELWGRDALGIGFGDLSHRAEERLADAEAEMSADPAAYAARNGITMVSGAILNAAPREWLQSAAAASGQELPGPAELTRALRDAFAKAIVLFAPDRATLLAGLGARILAGPDARESFACAMQIERSFLADWQDGEGRRAQILLGSPHPERAMSEGTALTRAAVTHLITGRQFADCLVEGLAELRLAQALRGQPEDCSTRIISGFDRIFFHDCQAALDDYRFAKNAVEMAI